MKCKECKEVDATYINLISNEFLCKNCYYEKYSQNKFKDRYRRRDVENNN